MSSEASDAVEFIRLGGHMVRVTTWSAGEAGAAYNLVTICRGTRDAELLDEILAQPSILLEIPDRESMTVTATAIDRREFGAGQARITRFGVDLEKVDPGEPIVSDPPASLEERVAHLERELAAIRSELKRLGPGNRPG